MGPSEAGPSTVRRSKKQKRRQTEESESSSRKLARLEEPSGNGMAKADRMRDDDSTSDDDEDPMDKLANGTNGADPMEGLENQLGNGANGARHADEDGDEKMEDHQVVPTRADEFEQQAETVVDAKGGLEAAEDEGKMKLVHQVRHQVSLLLHCYPSFGEMLIRFIGCPTPRLSLRSHRPA